MQKLVLASGSPRRIRMLKELGVEFSVAKSNFREPGYKNNQSPSEFVRKNAQGKAGGVVPQFDDALIIGADTVVVYRNRVLGKPETPEEAFEHMQMLKGRTHAVYSGICLVDAAGNKVLCDYEKTFVTFRKLTDSEISFYLSRINPMDKAGAYAIQGEGALIVEKIKGCYYNVVGFPLARLEQMLLDMGKSLFEYMGKKSAKNIRI
jgi:septum formation protein